MPIEWDIDLMVADDRTRWVALVDNNSLFTIVVSFNDAIMQLVNERRTNEMRWITKNLLDSSE